MKRFLTALMVLGMLFTVGCYQAPVSSEPTTPNDESGVQLSREPPEDVTWISPGKIQVGNFYPGARAEWILSVHNGNDTASAFAVTYRYPDHVEEEYAKPTEEVQDWVIIADATPLIAPRETREILVALAMPKDSAVFAPNWEFWVSVKDTTQTGMVQTELCVRWLITMR